VAALRAQGLSIRGIAKQPEITKGREEFGSGGSRSAATKPCVSVGAMAQHDQSLLQAALVGYEQERQRIEAAIADLRRRLGRSGSGRSSGSQAGPAHKKHRISAEGRRRIAEAQRRRWAAAKKQK
jgi:hypothetical protein